MPSEKYDRGRKRPAVVASVSLAFGLKEIEEGAIGPIGQIALLLAALAFVIAAVARLIEVIGPLSNKRRNSQAQERTHPTAMPEITSNKAGLDDGSPQRKTTIRELKRNGKSSKHKGGSKKKGKRDKDRR